jgi:Zn-dependent peptidase ImmA (M78 family)/transcriptional regulator with XRE-family HTH domain
MGLNFWPGLAVVRFGGRPSRRTLKHPATPAQAKGREARVEIDLQLLGSKLSRYRGQFQATLAEVSRATGMPEAALAAFEGGQAVPTGDQILVLADYYKCDFKFFISNERLAPFEQTETLFRRYGDALSRRDRWAIQEFLFLCECEEYLLGLRPLTGRIPFSFTKAGSYYKGHGEQAAAALRRCLGYAANAVGLDVFGDLRRIGLHVFRRALDNSDISGLSVRHPTAGQCVLVNYAEDIYRQRFTAAHEAGHAILDDDRDVVVSFGRLAPEDLSEIRADTFASRYLMPPEVLGAIPEPGRWTPEKAQEWAGKLKVSTAALARALKDAGLVDEAGAAVVRSGRVPAESKSDPELPADLSPSPRQRKAALLRMGLSDFYVSRCIDAYEEGHITAGRLAEMLLVPPQEVGEVAGLYGRRLASVR